MPYNGRVLSEADLNEHMQYLITHMRSSSLKLLDLKPDKSKDLGPYQAIGLKLALEGRFTEIDEFLKWVETDQRLLRIDSIKLDPASKDPGRLTAQVVLVSLAEKAAPTEKGKPEIAKRLRKRQEKSQTGVGQETRRADPQEQGYCRNLKSKMEVAKKQ